MKTDVQTLIAALTTERNSLDRAITALQMISPEKASSVPKPMPRRRRGTRTFLTPETKLAIVARMDGSDNLMASARRAAKEYGGSVQTIYTGWRTWQRMQAATPANGNIAEPIAPPVAELATA